MTSPVTLDPTFGSGGNAPSETVASPVLVVVWASAPERIGEVLLVDATSRIFGRERRAPLAERTDLVRQRPGMNERTAPFDDPVLSRQHLRLVTEDDAITVENLGRRELLIHGEGGREGKVQEGDLVEIRGVLSFLCTMRPRVLPRALLRAPLQPFGEADAFGVVGEGPVTWELRRLIAFFGARSAHLLVTGESGTGKELVAQAIHAISSRGKKRIVSRNAATLPSTLIDAELFGNAGNYPQAGMAERPGLIGEANGSTLFLDEIGELSTDLQAHLLRVMDEGEYQRLGDAKRRQADFRLIAATNRPLLELKHDVAARLPLRLDVPDLNARRDDIMLLARHLLIQAAARDQELQARFCGTAGGLPKISADLARALVTHSYTHHVRELGSLLWASLSSSEGKTVDLTRAVTSRLRPVAPSRESPRSARARTPTEEETRAALARHEGVRERVWRELGLPSRHALHRLLKKYGIDEDA